VYDSFPAGASLPASTPISTSPELERWYRRLVACYPRSFRRQNTEEIIAVLLATAREGQRRPSLAEAADLLRGAARMRTGMSRSPWTVQHAVRLMWLGAVGQLALMIIALVTADSTPVTMIATGVIWVMGLVATILLLMKQSWPYFEQRQPIGT
jgi:hypothetical protein